MQHDTLNHMINLSFRSSAFAVDVARAQCIAFKKPFRPDSRLLCSASQGCSLAMLLLLQLTRLSCPAKLDCCREHYTLDHLTRLKQFEAQTPYSEAKCPDYCKDYHVQPCRACTTCHFCRYVSSYHASFTHHTAVSSLRCPCFDALECKQAA